MTAMRTLFLLLAPPFGTYALRAEGTSRDLTCEICRKTNRDGTPCEAKVTRGPTTPAGINYTCANGHAFTVEPKTRTR